MWPLLKKEINGFFSSLTGYIVIIVFLLTNSLFMWVFPGNLNVFDSGYANIETLFIIAPWVFLFLVAAITMSMFADEKQSGTIELLFTRPISDFQIIIAKYLASVILVLLSILPTLVYFYSVYILGNPVGNIDIGGTWGSFIGLFFLAAIYTSIGLFSSSLTSNQIVAFIIAVVISFFMFMGFDTISSFKIFSSINTFVLSLGINEHYNSMSRGVIDSRDMIYFLSVISLFLLFTKTVLQSRKW
ncbi:MAG: gliding motility-associated ABC transporter permease subunit GldF [Bacteroidales bacterium]|jgi:ABC-2 type transport system permease protein|nr:gliding motility-associated ABC transporter permease subunit GldF [Bacteroidales bacterium]